MAANIACTEYGKSLFFNSLSLTRKEEKTDAWKKQEEKDWVRRCELRRLEEAIIEAFLFPLHNTVDTDAATDTCIESPQKKHVSMLWNRDLTGQILSITNARTHAVKNQLVPDTTTLTSIFSSFITSHAMLAQSWPKLKIDLMEKPFSGARYGEGKGLYLCHKSPFLSLYVTGEWKGEKGKIYKLWASVPFPDSKP